MGTRSLGPDEAALWARVMAGVRPLRAAAAVGSPAVKAPATIALSAPSPKFSVTPAKAGVPLPPAAEKKQGPRFRAGDGGSTRGASPKPSTNTLDGTWDRQLARGLVSPDRTIDLHGHTLHSAYDLLDAALDAAIRAGDRVILLVTGKPPRPTSERPHARGAIRAATGDWLAGSRHAAAIAAVRGAHPRHGGAGALYIVLKRHRSSGASPKF